MTILFSVEDQIELTPKHFNLFVFFKGLMKFGFGILLGVLLYIGQSSEAFSLHVVRMAPGEGSVRRIAFQFDAMVSPTRTQFHDVGIDLTSSTVTNFNWHVGSKPNEKSKAQEFQAKAREGYWLRREGRLVAEVFIFYPMPGGYQGKGTTLVIAVKGNQIFMRSVDGPRPFDSIKLVNEAIHQTRYFTYAMIPAKILRTDILGTPSLVQGCAAASSIQTLPTAVRLTTPSSNISITQ